MSIPADLLYARSHEWIRAEDDGVVIGITEYAQDQLGDVIFVDLPQPGDSFEKGDEFGSIESVKAVSEFLAPVAGEVIEINERLEEEPNLVNADPYGDGWLVKISGSSEGDASLTAEEYEAFLEEENG